MKIILQFWEAAPRNFWQYAADNPRMTAMTDAAPFHWSSEAVRDVEHNYLDECSSRWLYLSLARIDAQSDRADFLRRLAQFEKRHAELWEKILKNLHRSIPAEKIFWDHRVIVMLARIFGVGAVLPLIHKSEADGISKYRTQARDWQDPAAQEAFVEVLPDEIVHEIDIFNAIRRRENSLDVLRSVILGANDGLASTLALTAGVAGATSSSRSVLIAGAAGIVAGAISMAASNYVSVKAEREVAQSQVGLEEQAFAISPKTKQNQLSDAYAALGLNAEEARSVSQRLAGDPGVFLKIFLKARYGIGDFDFQSPLQLAAYTGLAFGLFGLIPLLPFIFLPALAAAVSSACLTALALFASGVGRSLSTLKPFLRSGTEMVLVGMGSAAVTYLLGMGLGGALQ